MKIKFFIILPVGLFISLKISSAPQISFYVELPAKQIDSLFKDATLIDQLVDMKASLRVGIMDFSPERTRVILKLNRAGIPVYAWMLLPVEKGYWFNMNNGAKALERYTEFKEWTLINNLKWEGIGIDIEPDFNEIKSMMHHPFLVAGKMYARLYLNEPLITGKKIYNHLIEEMKSDGNKVESYIIPWIYDEREAGTTSFQKLLGLLDIETPVEIPMVYTSVSRNPEVIPSYYHEGMPLALGSTGGGVSIEGMSAPAITWDDLERDILIAGKLTNEIVIFSLEGSWEKGWLPRIAAIDYTKPVADITARVQDYARTRKNIQRALIAFDHPMTTTITLIIIFDLILYLIVMGLLVIKRLVIK